MRLMLTGAFIMYVGVVLGATLNQVVNQNQVK